MAKLKKMDYSNFIDYLNKKKIKFVEKIDVDIDYWFTEFTEVTPMSKKLKPRYFNNDGGMQLS